MDGSDVLETLVEPTIRGLGCELWGIERQRLPRRLLLRFYIDSEQGITLADCERVSAQLRDLLESERVVGGDYLLEVSSPGLDRPLFKLAHYQRFCGEQVQVRLRVPQSGRRRLQGQLLAADAQAITVDCDDENFVVPLTAIERVRVVPQWPEKPQPRTKPARRGKTG